MSVVKSWASFTRFSPKMNLEFSAHEIFGVLRNLMELVYNLDSLMFGLISVMLPMRVVVIYQLLF